MFSIFFSYITRHSFQRMCQNVVLGFRNVLIGKTILHNHHRAAIGPRERLSCDTAVLFYNIVTNYKWWNVRYVQQQDSFYSKYFAKTRSTNVGFDIVQRNILLSGDVELNPGPATNDGSLLPSISNTSSDFLLNYRLYRHGLRPLDVGGGGDCFFKSVSHQLYGDSNHHLEIRTTAVQYLRDNPDRFIESIVDQSWLQYLFSMSMQGTWADHVVIQAVANSLNLKIHIIESNEQFSEITVLQGIDTAVENLRSIFRTC